MKTSHVSFFIFTAEPVEFSFDFVIPFMKLANGSMDFY